MALDSLETYNIPNPAMLTPANFKGWRVCALTAAATRVRADNVLEPILYMGGRGSRERLYVVRHPGGIRIHPNAYGVVSTNLFHQ